MPRKITHEVGPFFYIADAGRMDTRKANKPYATAEEAALDRVWTQVSHEGGRLL